MHVYEYSYITKAKFNGIAFDLCERAILKLWVSNSHHVILGNLLKYFSTNKDEAEDGRPEAPRGGLTFFLFIKPHYDSGIGAGGMQASLGSGSFLAKVCQGYHCPAVC